MQDFMKDRYGVDDLSLAIGTVGVVLALVGSIFSIRAVSLIALVVLLLDLARAFSKNFDARQRENDAFRAAMAKLPVVGEKFGGAAAGAGASSARSRSSRPGAKQGSKPRANMDEVRRNARTAKKMWKDRKTKAFLKCPNCGQTLSVPKGKGRLIVTCPKCHTKMETRS